MPVIALDVGTKRIGVAVTDPTETYALPITVVQRTNLAADLVRIEELVREYDARELVVGDPIRLSGERGPAAEQIDRFVEQLRSVFEGRIHRVDERLTTAQVQKTLIAADVSRAKRKTVIDKMAAALILETFLALRRRRQNE
jgi:putative holliday junction resolvase